MTQAMPKRQDIDIKLTWDTSLIYSSDEVFRSALTDYKSRIQAFELQYKGKLTEVATIITALKELEKMLSHFFQNEDKVVRIVFLTAFSYVK